jgi:hypothetical protein
LFFGSQAESQFTAVISAKLLSGKELHCGGCHPGPHQKNGLQAGFWEGLPLRFAGSPAVCRIPLKTLFVDLPGRWRLRIELCLKWRLANKGATFARGEDGLSTPSVGRIALALILIAGPSAKLVANGAPSGSSQQSLHAAGSWRFRFSKRHHLPS